VQSTRREEAGKGRNRTSALLLFWFLASREVSNIRSWKDAWLTLLFLVEGTFSASNVHFRPRELIRHRRINTTSTIMIAR